MINGSESSSNINPRRETETLNKEQAKENVSFLEGRRGAIVEKTKGEHLVPGFGNKEQQTKKTSGNILEGRKRIEKTQKNRVASGNNNKHIVKEEELVKNLPEINK